MALNPIIPTGKSLPVINRHIYGIQDKPQGCDGCMYRKLGSGFVPDSYPSEAKIAFVFDAPTSDDILYNVGLSGQLGSYWSSLLLRNGFTKKDILVSSVLRCKGPGWDFYPTGKMRQSAEESCRHYDKFHDRDTLLINGGIRAFNPNLFVITEHPKQLMKIPAYTRLFKSDIKKAYRFVEQGYRPCVLLGDKAMNMIFPRWTGGVKRWRGNFVEARWPS